jgi:GAF domain-containing protein
VASIVVVFVGGVVSLAAAIARERSMADARRLQLLNRIGEIADGSLALDQTLRRVTSLVVPALADVCMIDAIGAGGMNRIAVRAVGVPEPGLVEQRLRRRRPSIPGYLRESGRGSRPASHFVPRADDAILRGIAHDEAEDLEFIRSVGVCSFVIVPLYARGRTLATLTLITTEHSGRTLDQRDVGFAEVMSGRIALALDNAGLFSDLESVERRLDAVMNLVDEGVIVHDTEARIVFANTAAAQWLSHESLDALLDSPASALAAIRLLDEDGAPMGSTADVLAHSAAPGEAWSALARVQHPGGEESWAELHYEPIAGTGGELLFGVTTIHDVTSIKRAEFTTTVLSETAQLLDSTRDYRLTLQAIAEVAVPRFADFCTVHVPGEDRELEAVALAHADPDQVEIVRRLQAEHPITVDDDRATANVLRTGEPALLEIDDPYIAHADAGGRSDLLRALALRSVLVVPLLAGTKVVGVVTYANRSDSRRFDLTDTVLASEIAARAGLAVENARLASEEAEIAQLLQRGLRPTRFPAMAGWDVASMYRSAGEVTEVGGDFYDAFRVDGGWLLAIGDVVGRGAGAASLTALARYTLRTAATLTNDAEQSLRQLHQAFVEHGKHELCSVALALLPDSGSDPTAALVLSAGHPLPLYLGGGGTMREVGSTGPLLGVSEAPSWPVESVELAPGDQLILYTDGVPEAKGEGERFGDERLRERVAGAPDPATAVRNVERALDEFCPGGAGDDAALVAIQRLPRPAHSRRAETGARHARREHGRLRPAAG